MKSTATGKKRRVMFDPGHGGKNRGAISVDGKLLERDLNLEVATRCRELLFHTDLEAEMTRNTDVSMTWAQRKIAAVDFDAELVVPIHFDSLPANPGIHGMDAYYGRGDATTKAVAGWIVDNAPLHLRGGHVRCAYDDPNRKGDEWLENPQAVVEAFEPDIDAILVECAFLSNQKDLAFLRQDYALDLIATTIVSGVFRYFQISSPAGIYQ